MTYDTYLGPVIPDQLLQLAIFSVKLLDLPAGVPLMSGPKPSKTPWIYMRVEFHNTLTGYSPYKPQYSAETRTYKPLTDL